MILTEIASGSDDPTAADQDLHPQPESTLQTDFEKNQYQVLYYHHVS